VGIMDAAAPGRCMKRARKAVQPSAPLSKACSGEAD
jgi:hypothetical protein